MPKGYSPNRFARREEVREIILATLAEGVKTTEELRIAIVDTKEVLYNYLKILTSEGLIESNHPSRNNTMKKWRLKRNRPATV